jgi:hypothetical protein
MRTLKSGAVYFAPVFSAGFVLGAVRMLWIVPLLGVRLAELMESPIMLAVTILAARRVVRGGTGNPIGVGVIGLAFLLAAEIALAVGVRHLSLREYICSRDPVSGTVYVMLLAAFAVMPFLVSPKRYEKASADGLALLDSFIPHPDVRERHEVIINAPAPLVFEVARNFDIQSVKMVRVLFWLRAKALRAKIVRRRSQGFIADMLALGWEPLAEAPGRYFVAGAACQPWEADVRFSAIRHGEFTSFAEPDRVKIAWTLEAEALGPARTRFATETRAVATDDSARVKFQRYWRMFRIGIVTIRRLLLSRVRREAEARQIRK